MAGCGEQWMAKLRAVGCREFIKASAKNRL
jgi:hypothetical protein